MSWEKVKLQKIIHKPISGEWGNEGNSIKIIRTTNFTNNGRLNLHEVVTRDIALTKVNKKKLVKGDTIIEKSGGSPTQPVGRVVYFNEDDLYLCNNFTSVIRPKENVNGKYLFWFLFNNHISKKTLKYQNKTTGIINLKLENYINEVEIPLPPLPIQEKIAAILDNSDALRRKDQELLKKYDELAQAIFIDMFGDPVKNEKGWEVKRLEELGKLDRGVSKHRPRNAPELIGGPYPLIQTGDVANSGGWIKYYRSTYSEIGLKQSKIWKEGTLCITIAANIAKTGILTFDACFPDSIVGFSSNEHSNEIFIQYWFSFFQKLLEDQAPESAQKNINLGILRDLKVISPPLSLQEAFTKKIELIKQLKAQANAEKSEELFQSLLQRAFKDELITEVDNL